MPFSVLLLVCFLGIVCFIFCVVLIVIFFENASTTIRYSVCGIILVFGLAYILAYFIYNEYFQANEIQQVSGEEYEIAELLGDDK